ncbi:MAG: ABC transporter ATP-binding protein [Bradyrhizobiaceae bacterium]|nr:ABC transporter ATP-binding protein [Bradyrhizobiaceae bacterium]
MISTLLKTIRILSRTERLRGAMLVAMMAVLAAMEVAGVASIAPFLAVMGNPTNIEANQYLSLFYHSFGFDSTESFLAGLAGFSLAMLILVSALRTLVNYSIFRYANMCRHSIGMRLMNRYLQQPYAFFLQRNSTDLSKTVLSEVDQLIDNAITPALLFFSYSLVLLALVALLLIVDPALAIIVSASMGAIYALVYSGLRGTLDRIGIGREQANTERYKAAAEIFGGIKELKVLGRDRAYVNSFRNPSIHFSRYQALRMAFAEIPKYLVEALGFAAVLIVALFLLTRSGGMGAALPLIGLYAYAGYRILPAMHLIYRAFVMLRFIAPAVDTIVREIGSVEASSDLTEAANECLPLRERITLNNVSFCYAGSSRPILRGVTISIHAGTVTAIVGATGVGKSTLVDLILGLLEPTSGQVLVDGTPLTAASRRAWNNNIGYVPQHIFLTDDTIARNIAFGVDGDQIDLTAVERAARLAQIHDFIIESLPLAYNTIIGERGIRLSGGQRQRLGIARALYHGPQIIVLDEAMNALDHDTELAVLTALEKLAPAKTIIMITHRLATTEVCDQVLTVEKGQITGRISSKPQRRSSV